MTEEVLDSIRAQLQVRKIHIHTPFFVVLILIDFHISQEIHDNHEGITWVYLSDKLAGQMYNKVISISEDGFLSNDYVREFFLCEFQTLLIFGTL